ncbi:MAG TPA: hypothetical protein VGG74_01525 [Kofleriaceae bacterium]|jgi:hypothetical protein
MSKKKKKFKRHPFRNATPVKPTHARNAAPRAPRNQPVEDDTPLKRLAYTASGAAGTALAGAFLAHEGWSPKTIATALGAVGAGLAWKGDEAGIRSVGAGAMSAAGAQLALMIIDERDRKAAAAKPSSVPAAKRQADADALPPGALEAALARAQARLALNEGELAQ